MGTKKSIPLVLLILIIAVIIVIGLLCYFAFFNKDTEQNNNNETENKIEEIPNEPEINTSEILYNGDVISIEPGIHYYGFSLNVNDSVIQEKYDATKYYNYENNEYTGETIGLLEGVLGDATVDFFGFVTNVKRIATFSELLNPFPREIKIKEFLDIEEEQLKKYHLVYELDLDGDGKLEYLCFEYRTLVPVEENEIQNPIYTHKYVTVVDLLNEDYTLISNLIIFNDYRTVDYADPSDPPLYLKAIDLIDIDNDGIIEILIDLYGYEQGGRVAIYKYEDNQVQGQTNHVTNILP